MKEETLRTKGLQGATCSINAAEVGGGALTRGSEDEAPRGMPWVGPRDLPWCIWPLKVEAPHWGGACCKVECNDATAAPPPLAQLLLPLLLLLQVMCATGESEESMTDDCQPNALQVISAAGH